MTDTQIRGTTGADAPVGPGTGPDPVDAGPQAPLGQHETILGLSLVGLVFLAGLYFHWWPGMVFLDHWLFDLIHPALANSIWRHITYLKSLPVLIGGSILAAIAVVARDRWRAAAVLVSPTLAVILTEWVLKDAVGRRYAQVVSFPSGTTTAVAALATAWVLVVPARYRVWAVLVAVFVVGLEVMAVIALLWHYPTDALAGAVFGAGVVFLVDGSLHLAVGAVRRRRAESETPYAGVPGSATGSGATPAPPPAT